MLRTCFARSRSIPNQPSPLRLIQTTAALSKQLPPRIKIDENDLTENFIKGGGSGGQKINKTSSQVQLIHHPTGIHIKCQATRSRSQNRTVARRILAERIEELQLGEQSRTALKAAKEHKKKASANKKKRRKYRKLAEDKEASEEDDEDEVDEDDDEPEETANEATKLDKEDQTRDQEIKHQ